MNSKLISFLLAGLSYYVLGIGGLTLAIPPGFASAVWPAAGAALFFVIFCNRPASLAGIWLGSFTLNLGINTDFYAHFSWAAAFPVVIIAFGAVFQAMLGYYLYRRFVGDSALPDTQHRVIRFLAIVAPIGCLLAPTVGINTLHELGIISSHNFWFSWLTWWAGDTLGVLLFTPLLLALASSYDEVSAERKIQLCLPILIIFVSVLTLFFKSLSVQRYAAEKDIEESAGQVASEITQRLTFASETLKAYDAFFAGSNHVSRAQYQKFSEIILDDNPIFESISWIQVVPSKQREQIEQTARVDGISTFSFTEFDNAGRLFPAPERESYHTLLYIYPSVSNERLLGLNVASKPESLLALNTAREKKRAIATAPMRLSKTQNNRLAITLHHPVFEPTYSSLASGNTPVDDKLKGFVSGVIRLASIFEQLEESLTQQSLGLSVSDTTHLSLPTSLMIIGQKPLEQFNPVYSSLKFGDRTFSVSVYPTHDYQLSSKDWTSWAILTGGVLIAAVLQGLILIITGGTELIKLEVEAKTSELTKAMKNLEVANAAKSTFTSTMSHEIRTPLNGVIGLLNQCLKTELTDKQHFYLTQAKLSSDTLLSLVNLVLDFSKIESGKLELEEAEFNLSHILKKIQAIFTELAGQKDIGFDLVLPEIIPETLIGDALRIEQILLNLCGNAVKFTEQGGVTLQLAVEEETESEVNIIIIVTDSGIGIAKGKIANLFNSYQQADSSTSRKFGGTGLGLTITRRLVELMDGKLSVSSQIGEGTQFTFQLKLRKTSECHHLHFDSLSETVLHSDSIIQQEENVKRQKSRRVNNHRRELSGCAILVVEDVAVNQLIAKEILQENGAVVTLADNGDMAIKELQTGEFDLVLMDIQMPIKDGYETTKLIRRLPKYEKLPIIAMTANVMSTDVQQAKDAGMNDHIAKPIDEKIMVAKIKSYLKADQSTKT